MKKKIYVVTMLVGLISFTSCAKDECVCDNGVTITESDAKDTGVTLNEACEFTTKTSGSNCSIN